MIIKYNRRRYSLGFTLIELMIVVAILSILASVAYPSYIENVRQARRADAQSDIVQYAAFAERIFTEVNDYRRTNAQVSAVIPNTGFYTYAVTYTAAAANPATDFTITATATNDQTNDPCVNMTLTNTGLTGATGPLGAACWQ